MCPYCGKACQASRKFREHIRDACPSIEIDCIPSSQRRRICQQDLDSDPCFATLHQVRDGKTWLTPMLALSQPFHACSADNSLGWAHSLRVTDYICSGVRLQEIDVIDIP